MKNLKSFAVSGAAFDVIIKLFWNSITVRSKALARGLPIYGY